MVVAPPGRENSIQKLTVKGQGGVKMPYKPKRPCSYPGCPELVSGTSYCEKHKDMRAKKRNYSDVKRDPEAQKLYDRKWKQRRKAQLSKYPWCEECLDNKIYTPATDVHHVIAHKGNREIFALGPLQSLCLVCHSKITRLESWDKYQVNYPFIKQELTIPVIMVCGAPASGKSTYVETHATNNDIIIDLDLIKMEISGSLKYFPVNKNILDRAIMKRNQILESLQFIQNNGQKAWFIVSAGRYSDRALWKRILNPIETLIMLPSKEVCIQRIESDGTRWMTKQEQITAVHALFDKYYCSDGDIEVRGYTPLKSFNVEGVERRWSATRIFFPM